MTRDSKYFDAIVIGAGLHGSSAALHLAREKLQVLMLDPGSGGRHASKVNAGGLRQLRRAIEEVPLAVEAAKMWRNIESLVDDGCGTAFNGHVYVAESTEELLKLEKRRALVQSLGYEHEEVIDTHELRALIPSISKNCAGGLICREDGFASPFRTTNAFQRKAESLGVMFRRQSGVKALDFRGANWRVTTSDGQQFEAPRIVNCAGAWGDQIGSLIGDEIPLSTEAPTMMVTAPVEPFLKPVVGAANRKLSFKQLPNGTVLIGGGYRGTLDRTTRKTRVDFTKLKMSAQTVIDFFPHMVNVPIVRTWAGIEGMTPDHLPIIGESQVATGVYHSFGYSAHGFLLAPIVGRLIAELVVHGKTSLPIEPFHPSRFNSSG